MYSTDCCDSRCPRCWRCVDLSHLLLSPPHSLGVTSQLCHSNVSWPNSALGRVLKPCPSMHRTAEPVPLTAMSPRLSCWWSFYSSSLFPSLSALDYHLYLCVINNLLLPGFCLVPKHLWSLCLTLCLNFDCSLIVLFAGIELWTVWWLWSLFMKLLFARTFSGSCLAPPTGPDRTI